LDITSIQTIRLIQIGPSDEARRSSLLAADLPWNKSMMMFASKL
jgi:hypothetical protein